MKTLVIISFVVLSAVLWSAFYTINKKKTDEDIKEFNKRTEEIDEEFDIYDDEELDDNGTSEA